MNTMRPRMTTLIGILTILFLVSPFVVVAGASLDTGNVFQIRFPPHGLSLARYAEIHSRYLYAFRTSFVLGLTTATVATATGLMAALGAMRGRLIAAEALLSFFRMPLQIPFVVTGAVYLQFYYQLVAMTGFNPMNSLLGLLLAHLFIVLPYTISAISAVVPRTDSALEEAAETLGATQWTTFWRITFPTLRPALLAGAFYAFIISFGDVPVSIFLVTPTNMTLPVLIFQDMRFDFQPSILAVSTLVSIISMVLIVGIQKLAGLDMVLPPNQRLS
jgi:putative spermidine/putrescine transport system permease protein